MPHPLRIKADGRPVYSIPFIVFQDDVSGNRSKQWNKHYVIYGSNAALPRQELNKVANTRFFGASTRSKPLEMMSGICQMFEETFAEPVLAWDAKDECEVFVRTYILCLSADNPMHAEHCSSTGLTSTYFCRTCKAGGSQSHRQSEEGFTELFKVSRLKTVQRSSGVKDTIAQPLLEAIQRRGEELTTITPGATLLRFLLNVLNAGFNVHLDTPTEILHTILLGGAKYFWRFTIKLLSNSGHLPTFFTRFNCLSLSGLEMDTTRIPDYICKNPGSITGTHFRFILQLAPFALHGLVDFQLLRVWLLLGRLTVLMWQSSIPTLEPYLAELTEVIDDFLHAAAVVDPRTITVKTKLHILTHAPFHVRRFGPLLGPDSERFESFNSVFRTCSVLSNREAPSLDIAKAMAGMDIIRHIALGGKWFDEKRKIFVSPGPMIRDYFIRHPRERDLLGLRSQPEDPPGKCNRIPIF
ncbi:hypothetical protein BDV93DRAFT_457655 [Ceratobasidium sp. AG-I]|nr:hypothetical protein BDV93DRAFT_457655 [Ceratobasidium sp. AG-I]